MSLLFSPLTIKTIHLKNRIVISPMCQYSAVDGYPNHWHLVHLGSRAVGGAALIFTEATAVNPEGRISIGDLGLWSDAQIPKYKEITDFIRTQGAVSAIQLAHAGRKGSFAIPWQSPRQLTDKEGGWETVSASATRHHRLDKEALALDQSGIDQVKADFQSAALRALHAGYDIIEIHAAHGYLIHQFLSPLSNFRKDSYGGSFENRIRLLREIIEEVKKVWPEDKPLFVRISATDWVEGGWNMEEAARLSAQMKDWGVDVVDTSSGGLSVEQQISVSPGYQVPFAEEIKRRSQLITGAVGLITQTAQAEEILRKGQADLIFIARESLRNPYFALNASRELETDTIWPIQYERAKPGA